MSRLYITRQAPLDARSKGFEYQLQAVRALRDLEYGGIFHEQGLGKTKIAVDLILDWLSRDLVDTVLIVAKRGLIANWIRELAIHTYLKPRVVGGNRAANFYAFNSPARVLLAHYEAIKLEESRIALFARTRRVAIVLDESTKIKNPKADLTRAFFRLRLSFVKRVIMTGTPVANRPEDLWAQIYFLDGGLALGSDFDEFRRKVELSVNLAESADERDAFEAALVDSYDRLREFTVRETKAGHVIALPKKTIQNVGIDWEPFQFEIYRRIRDDLGAIVIRNGIPVNDDTEEILKRLLRLVQVASNPRLVDESYRAQPGKLPTLIEILRDVRLRGERAIVWTSFTDNAEWLQRELNDFSALRLHGRLPMDERNGVVERFLRERRHEVLVATPGAAKEGLTLTVANHVIFFDRSFSLDDYLQAQDRIHRVTQTRECFVYNLIMRDSIDEWVESLIQAKHLSAQLAQGDVSVDDYREKATYDFGEMLRSVLHVSTA